jgi:DNA-directed RNA polymerase specialized sigma24 family protein
MGACTVTLDPPEARDAELLLAVSAGEEEAFRSLFARYGPNAMAVAQRIVRQRFLAEEIVQEVFLSVWRDPQAYERRRAEELVGIESRWEEDPADRVAEEVDLPQERRAVRAAMKELPAEQREVVELMYFGGLSQSAIADRLSVPLGTVKSRTLLAMRKLRSALEEPEP